MASPLASVWVKNTFLEFRQEDQQDDDDDLWIDLPKPLTRQVTDSILDQQSRYGLCGNRAELPQRTKENHPQVTDDVDRKLSDASTGTPEYEEEGSLPGNQISEPEKEIEPALREAFEGATGLWPDDEDEDVSDSGIGENSDAIIEAVSAVANRRALMKHLGENGQAHPDGGSGTCPLRGRTTVMMRHIPCKYTQQKVMKEINHAGFLGRYDFFYLPMDSRSRSNRGFAFINLDSPAAAEAFFQTFDGKKLRRYEAVKALAVMPADLQGFERNAAHYAASRVLRRKRNPHSRPLFFRPLPTYIQDEVSQGAATADYLAPSIQDWKAAEQAAMLGGTFTGPLQHQKASETMASAGYSNKQQRHHQQHQAAQARAFQEQQRVLSQQAMLGSYFGMDPDSQVPYDYGQQWDYMQPYAPAHGMPFAGQQSPPMAAEPDDGMARDGASKKVCRFCVFCGKPKSAEHRFCPFCGAKAPVSM